MNYLRSLGQKEKKTEMQKDKKTKRQWIGLRRHPDDLQWTTKIKKFGDGEAGGMQCYQVLLIYQTQWSIDLDDVDLRWMFENWCYIHLRWSCSYQLPNSFNRFLKFFQVHIQKYVSPRHNGKCYGSLRAVDKIKYGNYTDLEMTEIESGKAITTKKWNLIWI